MAAFTALVTAEAISEVVGIFAEAKAALTAAVTSADVKVSSSEQEENINKVASNKK
tara:strand:+ start:629 stop:796 length:168 start_codon:yes stop_codon:yes gene_type:complete